MTDIKMKSDTPQAVSNEEILALLKKQQEELNTLKAENQDLKSSLDGAQIKVKVKREMYNWPRKYSYKSIDWKVITSLKMTKNKQTQVYRDWKFDWFKIEQEALIGFHDWTETSMPYEVYYQAYVVSEPEFPKEIINRDWTTYYRFEKDGQSFEVSQWVINW